MKGYTFDITNHLWHRQDFAGIAYSDGQEIEERISSIMSETPDRSVLSEELRQQITDWPTEYHFSRLRHCLLRPLGIQAGDRVLELGCGCGAITRYLGETGAEVVAVEGSGPRARIAAQRCKDLENVRVVLENLVLFDTEQHFDWVLLIGVLEYAPLFAESVTSNPVQKYLESSSAFLADNGKLVVAIENQLGLKYFNGCGEDHVARPFFGIHDLYNEKTPVTFGKKELQGILCQAGLSNLDFFYPWPDYKLPSVILHSSAFTEPHIHISDLLMRCDSRDYLGSSLRVFSEQFSLPVLERNGLLEDLANSFLVVAGKRDQGKSVKRDEFVWIYSCDGRQKSLCTESTFFRNEELNVTVRKNRMDRTASEPVKLGGECAVIHRCGSGPFYHGHLFIRDVLRKRAEITTNRAMAEVFLPWFQEVRKLSTPVDGNSENQLEKLYISGKYIDATPFNFIRTASDELLLFDTEWEVDGVISLGWLLYRSVVWGWFGEVPGQRPQQTVKSVYGIIDALCALSSLEVNASSMMQWQEMELQFQSVISLRQEEYLPQFLSLESGGCFSYVEKQQQRIDILNASVGIMQQQLIILYSSPSWRYSGVIRYVGKWRQKVRSLLHKVSGIPKPFLAISKMKAVLSQDGWKGVQLRIACALHGASGPGCVSMNESTSECVEINDYAEWIRRYDTLNPGDEKAIHARIDSFVSKPCISIVMPVFDPPVELLKDAIQSVLAQFYPYWELCIADDASTNKEIRELLESYAKKDDRIKVVFREQNGHIARCSNSALELVQGQFVALLDHDDILSPHALFLVADAIQHSPDVQLIYSDEDKIDLQGKRYAPLFKCDWNPDLFLSYNLFSHFGVYRTSLIQEVEGFRPGFEGAQDYDLALRCTERVRLDQIVHIPHVLYHWRAFEGSTALATAEKPYALVAGERAINEYLQRNEEGATCELQNYSYRVRYSVPPAYPLVSLIIPTVNGGKNLRACLESILTKTTYDHYEILIVNSCSQDRDTIDYLRAVKSNQRIRIIQMESPENNDAQLYNRGVQEAQGEIIGFLHDDVMVITNDWLEELLSQACREEIGVVGARLWHPDNTLAHGGFILGIHGAVGAAHRGTVRGMPGYKGRAEVVQSLSAVSAACLFVEKKLFEYVGRFDEGGLGLWLYDVELSLKLREQGYRNLWTPYAELYHLETGFMNREMKPVRQADMVRAKLVFLDRWGGEIDQDPAYSPNLTLNREDFSLAWPPRKDFKKAYDNRQ